MRDIDDQMDEILKRADVIKNRKAKEKYIIGYSLAIAACLALLIISSVFIVNMNGGSAALEQTRYGSLIISASNMGYVIIGLLSFILGLLVTLLCVHIRELRRMDER